MPHGLISPMLIGVVLVVGVVGRFDRRAMQLVADCAARHLRPNGPGFEAVLLDLSQADPVQMTPGVFAKLWHERLPMRPCAILRAPLAAGFCRQVALLLASAKTQPTPVDAFDPEDRAAAMQWCVDRAATLRCELDRRRRKRASNPGGSG